MRGLAALALCAALAACAGVPIGGHAFVVVGIGIVRVERAGQASAISSRMIGLQLGCGQATLGAAASYCARIPITGDVAILERGAGPDQHLTVRQPKEHTP